MVILTKDGNAVRVTTKDDKVVWLSIDDFMNAFTLDKETMTVSIVTNKIKISSQPISELTIAGNSSLATAADLGNAIKDLCEMDTDGGAVDLTGYELKANKDADALMTANSDTLYPSQKAVKTRIAAQIAAIPFADLTTAGLIAGNGSQIIGGFKMFAFQTTINSIIGGIGNNKTANYTVPATVVFVNCTANSFTVTLPTAVGITGKMIIVKNSGAGVITMATTSSQTIDGTTPGTIAAGAVLRLFSDGTGWQSW